MAVTLFYPEHGHKEFWWLSVIGPTLDSVAETCCITVHTTFHGILATFVPATCPIKFNKSNFVRHVAGTKYPPNWCCTSKKVSVYTRRHVAATHPWDMFPQHFHVFVILSRLHVPGYTSLLHVASVCTTQVFCRCNISLQHVPATCPCNITLRV